MGTVTALRSDQPAASPTMRVALDAWADHLSTSRQSSGHYTSANTIRNYRMTLAKLVEQDTAVGELDPQRLAAAFRQRWGQSSATTWNARRAAVRAFSAFAQDRGWLTDDLAAGLNRESEPRSSARARNRDEIDRLIRDKQRHALRDRALWSMLYETFARAEEVLSLNVDDLDLKNRTATVTRKGGDRERIMWDTRTARLLSRLIGKRTAGPLFLTDRAAKGGARGTVDARDLDPESGRGRLGYSAALKTFKAASGGWTLHDLRHSALTHAAEDGVDTTVLMAKSGHRDIRSLGRYARPSVEHAQRAVTEARERRGNAR